MWGLKLAEVGEVLLKGQVLAEMLVWGMANCTSRTNYGPLYLLTFGLGTLDTVMCVFVCLCVCVCVIVFA